MFLILNIDCHLANFCKIYDLNVDLHQHHLLITARPVDQNLLSDVRDL